MADLVLRTATQMSDTVFMPKNSGEKRDFMQVAREIVERAIGEKMDGSPLDKSEDKRNPHAVALGKVGGKRGGIARAKALSPARRKAIAKKAAKSRWKGE
jgi:hypothetical protein